MTQLYFKFVNHFNDIDGIPTFWGLKSKLNSYQNDKQGGYVVNGVWYDLNDYYKKVSGHDINDNSWTSNLQWLYMFSATPSNYTLPIAYLSVYDTQQQADSYDVNNAHYSLYKIIDQTHTEQPNYGQNVSLTSSSSGYDLRLGENKTYYLRIDIGNPTSTVYNYPFVNYNHQPFNSYLDTKKQHIYDNINDITCAVLSSISGIVYTGKSTTDVYYDIDVSGTTSAKKFNTNNKDYRTNFLNYNEYYTISPHDNSKPITPPEPVKQATVNINTGNFELVTPISNKIDVGSKLTIKAVPNKTYLIDFDNTIVKFTDVNGNITNYKFNKNSNSQFFNRKDGSSQTGVYGHIDNIEAGTYDINIAVKHGYINIDYSETPHTWLENNNQKITQLLIDTDYTLKVASADNWSSTNVELDGGMYDSNMFHGNNQAKTGDTVKVLDSDLVENDVFMYGLALKATETQNVVQTYAEINSTLDGANLNLSRLPVGKSSTLTITADDNHVLSVYSVNQNFADAFYKIGENGQTQYRFMFDDKTHKSASCTITPSDTSVITVTGVTKWSNQPESQRKQVPIILNLTHCKSNTSSLPENTDEEFENNHIIEKTITLTADDGYIFDKDVIYYDFDLNTNSYYKDTAKATNKNTISFSMLAGAYDDLYRQKEKPKIIAVANPAKEDVSTGLDSIHIYHMRNAELDNLSNKLISYFQTTANGDTEIQDYDYTRFINQVYRLPFSIPSSIEVDTTKVSAGLFNLNMNTKTIKVDHYDIDIGTIKINSKDATSYNAIKATLYLPFISSVQLDINDIVGHTISITYRINLLNGMNTLIVENENGLIYNQNVNIATNLQLFGAYYDKNVGSLNSVLNNNLRQAYIVIERKTPITNLLTYPTNEHGLISDYKGLTKFANTQLHLDATFQEKQEILAQLEQGVNIK